MKFRIQVESSSSVWWEEYDKPISDPQKWASEIVEYFNHTLRPGESPRKLLRVEVLDQASQKEHSWVKQNAMTVVKGGMMYDVLKCSVCGISAKRYGIGEKIIVDTKYRAKVYGCCDTALAYLRRKRTLCGLEK